VAESLFSKIIKREIPAQIVYEDDNFIAILDINPVNPGHTLLIPKEPFKDIFDMPENLLEKVGPLLKKLSGAVKEATEAEGLNIGMNNGEAAGQVIFHAHIHIMPRIKGDGHQPWKKMTYQDGQAKEVAEKIRKAL